MTETRRLTISIVNHGNRDSTLVLLGALAEVETRPDMEIVVLDNASADGSAQAIPAARPAVRVIAQGHRAGFGANHNTVIGETGSDYVLLLNDDAVMDGQNVRLLMDYMDSHPQVAAAGPRIVSAAGTRLQTAWSHLGPARAALFACTAGQRFWVQSGGSVPRAVGRLSGCALMLRRAALPTPAFDEGFFMYAEDSDLSVRLRASGHELHFVPGAVATHGGRQSSATAPARRRVEQSRSTHRYLDKHYGALASAFTRAALALGYGEKALAAATLSFMLRRQVFGASASEFAGAARDALRVPSGPGLRELADDYNRLRRHERSSQAPVV
jgi:N-acetylglucosaminyl-diphospho-decaprenol L-rhamnosyltransferase